MCAICRNVLYKQNVSSQSSPQHKIFLRFVGTFSLKESLISETRSLTTGKLKNCVSVVKVELIVNVTVLLNLVVAAILQL